MISLNTRLRSGMATPMPAAPATPTATNCDPARAHMSSAGRVGLLLRRRLLTGHRPLRCGKKALKGASGSCAASREANQRPRSQWAPHGA
jgi:hypothetical protein